MSDHRWALKDADVVNLTMRMLEPVIDTGEDGGGWASILTHKRVRIVVEDVLADARRRDGAMYANLRYKGRKAVIWPRWFRRVLTQLEREALVEEALYE